MMAKKIVTKAELLAIANERIRTRAGFIEGMEINEAEMKGPTLLMRGECFLNADGSATARTAPALDFYNRFAAEFADEYELIG